jgi:NAD(P)H-hydrate repair Nnr-like enzyme with NAD(P)H-hydrate dehydratase domain
LAHKTKAVVVLKGSGSVVAEPLVLEAHNLPTLNASGHAALATPGSGDVLAGWLGGLWSAAAHSGASAATVAREAVLLHGRAAETAQRWPLCASDLIAEMHRLASMA